MCKVIRNGNCLLRFFSNSKNKIFFTDIHSISQGKTCATPLLVESFSRLEQFKPVSILVKKYSQIVTGLVAIS